ncbi:MAG: calcium/calmodulin-dependent protein kinase-like protein [Linnemannia elongata]|nr:MAG: calcium/calmodulin-dependent protein kinase-like protein [Linnemannia elongata]
MNLNLSSILHLQPPSYERKKHYEFGRDLGTGTYGTVKKARALDTGNDVAVKIILKKTVKGHEDMVEKEIGVLKNLSHPNIVNFLDWFESRDKYYLVFDLASGGELFDRICEKGAFTENNAATIMKEVIEAIEYLHSKNVVHRDLKPENLLYKDESEDSKLMIVDFGISKTMESEDQVLTTMCGSYGYAAPEVLLRRGHGKPVDMWSIGIITYTLLCGYAPFQAENDQQLVAEIARCNVIFHQRYWKDVSVEARDFIKCLLRAHPEKRLTATEALQHKWITTETGNNADLLDNVKEGFNAKRMFKKTIRAVAAANRLRSMTRSNTEMTNSDAGSLASSLATPESQQQQQQEQQQPQQAEAAVPVTAEKS